MGETRNMDAAVRVEKMNDARKKIGGEPFLEGDSVIQEAIEYGLCQELVLNDDHIAIIIEYRANTCFVICARVQHDACSSR